MKITPFIIGLSLTGSNWAHELPAVTESGSPIPNVSVAGNLSVEGVGSDDTREGGDLNVLGEVDLSKGGFALSSPGDDLGVSLMGFGPVRFAGGKTVARITATKSKSAGEFTMKIPLGRMIGNHANKISIEASVRLNTWSTGSANFDLASCTPYSPLIVTRHEATQDGAGFKLKGVGFQYHTIAELEFEMDNIYPTSGDPIPVDVTVTITAYPENGQQGQPNVELGYRMSDAQKITSTFSDAIIRESVVHKTFTGSSAVTFKNQSATHTIHGDTINLGVKEDDPNFASHLGYLRNNGAVPTAHPNVTINLNGVVNIANPAGGIPSMP